MEKHHKLRRPPGSSIHGCNICGIEGHQAANCPNGTVDWKEKYGLDFFFIPRPYYQLLMENYVEHDLHMLKKKAKAYARRKAEEEEKEKKKAQWKPKPTQAESEPPPQTMTDAPIAEEVKEEVAAVHPMVVTSMPQAGQEIAAQDATVQEPAPPATSTWETYFDTYGRPYYHNRTTGTTQWEKPDELGA